MCKRIIVTNENIHDVVKEEIKRLGNDADLNHIDVSGVTRMNNLFAYSIFKGDISKWDVSNVVDMYGMFYKSIFNQDISRWDVSNVVDMGWMFSGSKFNQDISNWDVSNVKFMRGLFDGTKFNGDISNWNVGNVRDMAYMFRSSDFSGDISKWNINLKNFFNNLDKLNTIPVPLNDKLFVQKLFNSIKYKNKTNFNNLSRKVYINHIRKRLKITTYTNNFSKRY